MSCNNKNIVPGTPAWENICQRCGLCCLLKCRDGKGNFYMTRVACENLDLETKKCRCYASEFNARGDKISGCLAHNGGRLNLDTLHNDYLVPGFCPYVKKFVAPNNLKRPKLDGVMLISESEYVGDLADYIIPNTYKLFRYNPHLNKEMHKKR